MPTFTYTVICMTALLVALLLSATRKRLPKRAILLALYIALVALKILAHEVN